MAATTDQCYRVDYESLLDRKREIEHELLEHSCQIIGDNLDLYIKVKHMTNANQNRYES